METIRWDLFSFVSTMSTGSKIRRNSQRLCTLQRPHWTMPILTIGGLQEFHHWEAQGTSSPLLMITLEWNEYSWWSINLKLSNVSSIGCLPSLPRGSVLDGGRTTASSNPIPLGQAEDVHIGTSLSHDSYKIEQVINEQVTARNP